MAESPPMDPLLAQRIEAALARLQFEDIGRITADRRIDELGIDSVSLSELLVLLEEDYSIDIDSEELFSLETFGELAELLEP